MMFNIHEYVENSQHRKNAPAPSMRLTIDNRERPGTCASARKKIICSNTKKRKKKWFKAYKRE